MLLTWQSLLVMTKPRSADRSSSPGSLVRKNVDIVAGVSIVERVELGLNGCYLSGRGRVSRPS